LLLDGPGLKTSVVQVGVSSKMWNASLQLQEAVVEGQDKQENVCQWADFGEMDSFRLSGMKTSQAAEQA
jgi:hypothetical protein